MVHEDDSFFINNTQGVGIWVQGLTKYEYEIQISQI